GYKEVGGQILKTSGAATEGMEKVEWATKRAQQEMVVLGREIYRGDFSRMPGTLSIIAQGLSPIALGIAGVTAALAAGAYAWYKWGDAADEAGEKATDRVVAAMAAAEKAKHQTGAEKIAGINKEVEQLEIENASLKREMDRLRVASATWNNPKGSNDDVASQLVASEIFANKERIENLKRTAQDMQEVIDKSAEQSRKTAEKAREYAEKQTVKALEHTESLRQHFIRGDEEEYKRQQAHTARMVAGQQKKFDQYRMQAEDAAATDQQRAKLQQSRQLAELELDRFIMANDHNLTLAELQQFEDAKANIASAAQSRKVADGKANSIQDFAELGKNSKEFMALYKVMAVSEILAAGGVRAEKSAAWGATWGGPYGAAAMFAVSWAATLANAAMVGGVLGGGGGGAPSGGGGAAVSSGSGSNLTYPSTPATPTPVGVAAQAPQQFNLTIVGAIDNPDAPIMSYNSVVNDLIPLLQQAAGNGFNVNVTMA
ncbi:MAG: hypothetical protein Q7S51_04435, partial [Gallionellaceae bacterium]|nr:hypothetical protein [Gallionellaceae bacterium]